ncbi:hypothetical protein ElyMa_002539700 [Elysia marginata]|uniref:BZIP domain-containing protein n=1 Tax=Elysia marginata TaxID=1093978 RepID=A0AAV4GXQ4_9GAST|nr:hypothetical protein ElyMa_002539700 [Elysia marginata]
MIIPPAPPVDNDEDGGGQWSSEHATMIPPEPPVNDNDGGQRCFEHAAMPPTPLVNDEGEQRRSEHAMLASAAGGQWRSLHLMSSWQQEQPSKASTALEDEKQRKQRIRNRKSAARSRQKQKEYVGALVYENELLKKEKTSLLHKIWALEQCDASGPKPFSLKVKEGQREAQQRTRFPVLMHGGESAAAFHQKISAPGRVYVLLFSKQKVRPPRQAGPTFGFLFRLGRRQ